jgi:RND family efflux transporter MFP subunit
MNANTKKLLIPVLVLGVAAAIFVLLVKTKPQAEPVTITEKAWPVAARLVQPGRVAPELTLYGRIEAQWDSRLSAALAADVLEVPVREGDSVAAGALLVRLDDADVQLRLAQAEARIASEQARHQANVEALPRERSLLALVRKELERTRDLVNQKLASQSALDSARQAVDRQAISVSAREQAILQHDATMAELHANQEQARLDLARTEIRAPFSGRIAQLHVAPGQRVRAGDGLVNIYDTDSLLVRAQIPDSQLAQVRDALADGARLSVSGELDGRPLQAVLQGLAGEVGQGGGVAGLFRLQDPDDGVRPGRFVRLTLTLPARDDLLALPAQALYGMDRIYLIDQQQRLRAHGVRHVGDLRLPDGSSQVLLQVTDLPAGSIILTTQLPNAVEGLKVSVVQDGQGSGS